MRKKKTKMVTKDTYELMFGQKAQKIIQCTKKYKPIKSQGAYLNGKPYID
tara:strand:+ start:7961 stop:8110 length:150 start_codon:yes stop_codon:yes gene_type:complete